MALVADWMQLGSDVFYRKPELYTMGWGGGFNLNDFMIAAAPLGGPIALTLLESQNKLPAPGKPLIFVFSSSGMKISVFKWNSGNLMHVDWSRHEELVCVQEDGAVLLYDMFGTYLHTFNLGQEVKDSQIKSAQVFTSFQETGLAVLTNANRIFVVNNIKEPKSRKYCDIPNLEGSSILCWCALREERQTSIIVSQGEKLLLVSPKEQQQLDPEWSTSGESVVDICVSTNARHIALYSNKNHIWIGSSDMCTKYCEYACKSNVKPKQIVWCGTGAVALLWEMTLELISVNGEATTLYLDSASHLVQEIDSVRIISGTTHDILHKVPRVVVETLGIGSMASGALLFEASKGYEEGSTRATDCLGMIKDSVEEAVIQCYQSAQHEFSTSTQKALVRAALFGKTFMPEIDPEPCRTVITTLRVLNAVRDHRVGLPLTWNQLEWLTIPVLLDRLVLRRLFPLALRIASYLKLPEAGTSRILAHWACYKVKQPTQKGDEQIAREINNQLGYTPGISYTDVASEAERVGRKPLAIKLTEYECRPSKQVPVFLRLGEDQTALKRALYSGDSDLIYIVLFHLRNKLALADFLMMIRNFPVAQSLYMISCHETDINQLRDILIQEDDFYSQALLRIKEAYDAKRIDSQVASLQGAADCFKKTKNEFASQLTEEHVKLIKTQIRLEESQQKTYVNKPLYDTIFQLIKDGQIKEADKLKSEFKVAEKRYCHLRVYGHAEANHWNELTAFSRIKKLPIGHEPFVDACLKFGSISEAQKYLPKVKEEFKVTYYIKCGLLEEAVKIAQDLRSRGALAEVANACDSQHQSLQSKIQNLMLDSSLKP